MDNHQNAFKLVENNPEDSKDGITSSEDACHKEVKFTISEEHMSQAELDELTRAGGDGPADFEKIAEGLTPRLQEATFATVNIGIVGDAGAGKSTFINSFRGLRATDKSAAKVSAIRHTTVKVTRYPVPDNQNIVLIDFPGVIFRNTGTGAYEEEDFNTTSYLKLYGAEMEKCDLFLVFGRDRVSDNIIWIAQEVKKMEKNVLFVRSRIDIDLDNESRDHPSRFPKGTSHNTLETQHFLEELRQATAQELNRLGYGVVKETRVFVISGVLADVASGKYDMSNLRTTICNTVSPDKKAVLIKSLSDFAIDTVHDKAEYLKSREVIAAAVFSTLISAAPVPGLGITVDIGVLVAAYHRVKSGLSLNAKSLRRLAQLTKKDYTSLKKFVDRRLVLGESIKNASGPLALRAIVAAAASGVTIASLAVTSLTLNITLPIVGGIVAAPASAALVVIVMREMINEMESCAVDLFKYAYGKDPEPAHIGILGKECSSRTEFLKSIRGIGSNDPGAADANETIKKPTECIASNNLLFVEFPSPQMKKTLFGRKINEEAYRKSFGEDLKQCDICLAFIDEDVTTEMITVAKMAREIANKVLFVWPNDNPLSTNQSDMISNCQMNLKKLKYGDIDASDIFIISTEYVAVTQDIGQIPMLRHAIFKELQDAGKTDRTVMDLSSDTLQLEEGDAGTILNSLPDGFSDEEMVELNQLDNMTDLSKSEEDGISKWEQTAIRIGIISDNGAGTNTFISSFLGYREKVASRTAAGSTQTEYTSSDPERPQNLTVIRFPAVSFAIGKPEDIKSRYMLCQANNMNSCDIFLVLCGEAVATETIWLTVEAMKMDKKVLFVKSKVDTLWTNGGPTPQQREAIMQSAKHSLADAIQNTFCAEGCITTVKLNDIFLISGKWENVMRGAFDMVRLRQAMIEELSDLQKQAFIMLCRDYSRGMIITKATLLKQMAWTQAVQSGALRTWSGRMVDTPVDLEKIRGSCEVYKRCLNGLDEASLEDLAKLSATSKEYIQGCADRYLPMSKGLLGTNDPLTPPSLRGLISMVARNGSTLMTLELANYSFETAVNYVSVFEGKAMHVVAYFLRKIISEQVDCAQALYKVLFLTK